MPLYPFFSGLGAKAAGTKPALHQFTLLSYYSQTALRDFHMSLTSLRTSSTLNEGVALTLAEDGFAGSCRDHAASH